MIPYVRDLVFDYGRSDQVSPLIRRVIAANPSPFTHAGTGTYIIGRGEVAVIDPGPTLPAHLDAILKAVEGEKVTAILVTHDHSDHSPLAVALKEKTGAPIIGCLQGQRAHAALAESLAHGVQMDDEHDADFRPDIEVCGGGIAASGPGWTIEAMPTPGHTSNHICYVLKEENALFSGDHIMGWSTTIVAPPDGDMQDYMASLEAVRDRDFAIIWPTHGPPITEVRAFLDGYWNHRKARETQILDALKDGPNKINALVPKLYADTDKRLYPAAACSMLAHMIDLTKRGVIRTESGEPGPDSEYRLAS